MKNVGNKKMFLHQYVETLNHVQAGTYAELLPLLKELRKQEVEKKESKKNNFNRKCSDKVHFLKKQAETRRNELRKQGIWVREYQCTKCNYWHLTHQAKYE